MENRNYLKCSFPLEKYDFMYMPESVIKINIFLFIKYKYYYCITRV